MLCCLSTILLRLCRFHAVCCGKTVRYMKGIKFFKNLYFYSSSSCHKFIISKFLAAVLKTKKKKKKTKMLGLWNKHQTARKLATLLTRTEEGIHMEDCLLCAVYFWFYKDFVTPVQSSGADSTEIENFSFVYNLQNHIDIIAMNL